MVGGNGACVGCVDLEIARLLCNLGRSSGCEESKDQSEEGQWEFFHGIHLVRTDVFKERLID